MKRWIAIGLLLASAILLALVSLLGDAEQSTPVHDARRASEPSESAAQSLLDDVSASHSSPDRVSAAIEDPAAALVVVPAATDDFELRVLVYETGEPAPNADVFVLALSAISAEAGFYKPLRALDEAEAKGTHYTSDADGRVTLPLTACNSIVYAERGRQAGFVRLGNEAELPSEIFLYEDASLTVQVVDESGAPRAGIEIAIGCEGESRFPELVDSAVTAGEAGTVVLSRVGMFMAMSARALASVRIQALLEPPVERRIDAELLERGKVVLVLPATGEVEVLLQGKGGVPWPEPLDVALRVDRLDRNTQPEWDAKWITLRGVSGRAVFSRVGLGARVFAHATLPGYGSVHGYAHGPTAPGERTTVVIDVDSAESDPMIEARLLDERRLPIANTGVMISVAMGAPLKTRNIWYTVTDEGGVLRQRARLGNASGPVRLFFAVRDDGPSRGHAASADLVAPLSLGTIQIGDLVLREGPLVCSGRVVDGQGRPIAGADLSLLKTGGFLGIFPQFLRARSDADGQFAIHGLLETATVYVFARARGFGEASLEVSLGRQDIVLVLGAAAKIAGSIAPSKVFRMDELRIACASTQVTANRLFSSSVSPAYGTGAFQFSGLAAGEFKIQVTTHPMVGLPLELGTVQVTEGEVLRDPRLQAVDVDSRLHRFEIAAFDPDGRSVAEFAVFAQLVRTDGEAYEVYYDTYDGRLRVASTESEIDVLVSAEGRRSVALICRDAVTRVTMPPALEVRLKVEDVAELLGSTYRLVPVLDFHGREERSENWDGVAFDAHGECRFSVANAGTHEVRFCLRKDGGRTGAPFTVDPVQTVDVRDTAEVQTFDVRLSPESLGTMISASQKSTR